VTAQSSVQSYFEELAVQPCTWSVALDRTRPGEGLRFTVWDAAAGRRPPSGRQSRSAAATHGRRYSLQLGIVCPCTEERRNDEHLTLVEVENLFHVKTAVTYRSEIPPEGGLGCTSRAIDLGLHSCDLSLKSTFRPGESRKQFDCSWPLWNLNNTA
jgi:hypothetical protein